MSHNQDGQDAPRRRGCPPWVAALVAVILLGALWYQVFSMTGLLWWDAGSAAPRAQRPAPPSIPELQTDWVDVDAYLGTHPVWQP